MEQRTKSKGNDGEVHELRSDLSDSIVELTEEIKLLRKEMSTLVSLYENIRQRTMYAQLGAYLRPKETK